METLKILEIDLLGREKTTVPKKSTVSRTYNAEKLSQKPYLLFEVNILLCIGEGENEDKEVEDAEIQDEE